MLARRLILAIVLLALCISVSGCALFEREPERPRTVEEFIGQPRVDRVKR
jgi:hypothetical protein